MIVAYTMTQYEAPNRESAKNSTHDMTPNSKNESIVVGSSLPILFYHFADERSQIGMRDGLTGEFKLVPRSQAVVSVFDSNFLIGDGIWVSRRVSGLMCLRPAY